VTAVLARPDIRAPGDIDAAWLTAVLQAGGVDAVVAGFTAEPVGMGQIGDTFRFRLRYARDGRGAPASLVGKFPAAGEESRATGIALGNYVREVRFYQRLAATARISTPRCWHTDVDEATSAFVLMLEDLAPAVQGDQLDGVTLDQARLVVAEAAKLHASHWADPALDEMPFVSGSKAAPPSAANPDAIRALWEAFKARYDGRLQPDGIGAGDWLCTRFGEFMPGEGAPRCLTHNDFRPDNMMFASAAGGRPFTMLDWQSYAYGTGATDLAYFLAGALAPEVRRANEPELLALYLAGLRQGGVAGYDLADLKRDYGRGAYLLFLTAFFAAMIVTQTERGDRMFLQMLGGAVVHMQDHGVVG
jgi:aminoglycoside phosphotransferase (APT) family kinase protein